MQAGKSEEDSFKACHTQGQGARVNCGVKRRWEKKEMGGETGVDPRQQKIRMAPGQKPQNDKNVRRAPSMDQRCLEGFDGTHREPTAGGCLWKVCSALLGGKALKQEQL